MKNIIVTLCCVSVVLMLWPQPVMSQFVWTKDALNPVLAGGAVGEWNRNLIFPCVLFNSDSSRYEMWFRATPVTGVPGSIGFATSVDGIVWQMHPTPVLEPDAGSWDENTMECPFVMRVGGEYRMYYMSYASSPATAPSYFGLATSLDGINWTKHPGNPILGPGAISVGDGTPQDWLGWEAGGPVYVNILPPDSTSARPRFWMWYSAYNSNLTVAQIGYAESMDGITWARYAGNPIVPVGSPGAWDDGVILKPVVVPIQHSDSTYRIMVYYGLNQSGVRGFGLAQLNWAGQWIKLAGNPVLTLSTSGWDATYMNLGDVVMEASPQDTIFHMWYSGATTPTSTYPYRIGHATAPFDISTLRIVGPSTSAPEGEHQLPAAFRLGQNYPNPFNASTTIEYQLTERAHASLKVFNMLGQGVAILVDEVQSAGYKSVNFDAAALPSGVYLYRLQAGDFVETKKLVLLK